MGVLRICTAFFLFLSLLYYYKTRRPRSLPPPSSVIPTSRTQSITLIHYEVRLRLQSNHYLGSLRCAFTLKRPASISLDFYGKEITSLLVNHTTRDIHWLNYTLDLSPLKTGYNEVEIRFIGLYTPNGLWKYSSEVVMFPGAVQGLHRVFPCFDQPDIKATYRLTVSVKKGWEVIGTDFPMRLTNFVGCCPDPDSIFDQEEQQPSTLHEFHPSVPYSPDHFCLCTGHFTRFTLQHDQLLTIYCRPELASKLNVAFNFEVVEKVIEYMHKVTGVSYCFPKLDVVYVPGESGYAASVVFLKEEMVDWQWEKVEVLREKLAELVAAQWVGVLLTYESLSDLSDWSSLRTSLIDDFLCRHALNPTRRLSLQSLFSLHKWESCAAARLYK